MSTKRIDLKGAGEKLGDAIRLPGALRTKVLRVTGRHASPFVRIAQLIETLGLPRVSLPHVRHLEGRLWEMRMRGRAGIARALYVTAPGKRVVVVRVFVKKTQKPPRREIELALERAQEC